MLTIANELNKRVKNLPTDFLNYAGKNTKI